MSEIIGFRRIRGRVIPIRTASKNKTSKGDIAKIGAGTAIAIAAGKAAESAERSAAHHMNTSKTLATAARSSRNATLFKQFNPNFKPLMRTAAQNRLESMRLNKGAVNVRKAGAAVGAGLVGAGVHGLLNKHTDLDEGQKATIASASTLGAYFTVRASHTLSHMPAGINRETGTKVGKKVLSTLKFAAKRTIARGFKL